MVASRSAALLLVTAACAQELPTFESFVELHERSYHTSSAEFSQRQALYDQRKAAAEQHNSNPQKMWTAGVNKLWDWTEPELKSLRNYDGSVKAEGSSAGSIRKHATFLQNTAELPEEKFWTNLKTAQYIRNQGACGSCWAVAASTILEGHVEIYTGKPRTFSVQELVECTPNPRHCGGDGGCKGATAELAMEWVMKNGCAESSQNPYTASDGMCPSTDTGAIATMSKMLAPVAKAASAASFGMTGWETLPKNEYQPLVRALAEKGPVAVSAAADAWFSYDSGIFNGCGKDAVVDHAVVAIGYGVDHTNGKKYWTIQNSWGADWGENGRIRLERHDESSGYCGMNNDPQKGIACQGETAPVPVCGMCGVLFDSVVPHFKSSL